MTETIERDIELAASLTRVWRSLTDPERLAEWLADEATLDLRPGGDASFRIGDERRTGWIEEVRDPAGEAGAALTFWWARDGETASRVELTLAETERGTTRLRIVETRPLEILDLVGVPAPRHGGASSHGPALVAA